MSGGISREKANSLTPSEHFVERCKERIPEDVNPGQLYRLLTWARSNRRVDVAECVKRFRGAEYWRFVLSGTPYYAVFREGSLCPATVFDHKIYRTKRWAAKAEKRRRKR